MDFLPGPRVLPKSIFEKNGFGTAPKSICIADGFSRSAALPKIHLHSRWILGVG